MNVKNSPEQITEHYRLISEFEEENNINSEIEVGLHSIFLISQNLPVRETSDFFSGENSSITESFQELQTSYALIKYGFYKQAMISLRIGFEIGLLSIYWSIVGKGSNEFREWILSKLSTPYRDKKFWKVLKSNQNIVEFDKNYDLIKEIKGFELSDFVHTKGIRYSNFGETNRIIKRQDKFENFKEWTTNFKEIVKILEILHLLRFPTLNLRYSTDFLLSKFGTINKIPQFGSGFSDEMSVITSFIPEEQLIFIRDLSAVDEEVKHIIQWLNSLPDLSKEDIRLLIIEDQKNNIKLSGFANWVKNAHMYDYRIGAEILQLLEEWAIENELMTAEAIIQKQLATSNNSQKGSC